MKNSDSSSTRSHQNCNPSRSHIYSHLVELLNSPEKNNQSRLDKSEYEEEGGLVEESGSPFVSQEQLKALIYQNITAHRVQNQYKQSQIS